MMEAKRQVTSANTIILTTLRIGIVILRRDLLLSPILLLLLPRLLLLLLLLGAGDLAYRRNISPTAPLLRDPSVISETPRCPTSAHHYSRSLLPPLSCLRVCLLACLLVGLTQGLCDRSFSVFIGLQADQGWFGETVRGPKWSIAEWQRQTVAGLSPHTDRRTEPPHKDSRWPSGSPSVRFCRRPCRPCLFSWPANSAPSRGAHPSR